MSAAKRGMGWGTVVAICGLAGVAVAFWIHNAFETPPLDTKSDIPAVQFGNSPVDLIQDSTAPAPDAATTESEMQLAAVMAQQNRVEDAKDHYREAVRLFHEQLKVKPDAPDQLNNLAWLLAANPYPEIRNGKEAVELAHQACEFTDWRQATTVGTLAAAYAEAGQFDEAVKTAKRAQTIALANGEPDVASRNEKLTKLYEAKQPYHESF